MRNDSDQPGRSAKGNRKAVWIDPRLIAGMLLVAASTVGVSLIISAADTTTEVYAARGTLVVGDRITAEQLSTVRVRLGSAGERYLAPAAIPDGGLTVVRTVAEGELVPASAVGAAARLSLTSIVVPTQGALASSIAPGSVVDVWSAERGEHDDFEPPSVLVGRAVVVRLVKPEGIIADRGSLAVEVRVPARAVADVLRARSDGDAISIVPSADGSSD